MRALAFSIAALAAGCSLFQPPAQAPASAVVVQAQGRAPAEQLLAFLAEARTMNPATLTAEARKQRRDTDFGRVKAALALTLAAPADDAEIFSLLEPVVRRDGGDVELRAMASFLHSMALDRRRLRENAAAVSARLRDERRLQDALRNQADAAQERAARLQQKLDALTELEKSLSDRQAPAR